MGVLLMLMTIGGLIVAAVLLVASLITKKTWLAKFMLGGVALWTVFYAVMLLATSLTSEERTIAVGDTDGKAFCGFYIDCHMHAMVTAVRRAKTVGSQTANGEYYIVKVKVFSDAKRATLGLLTVDAHVVDIAGRTYTRDRNAEAQLGSQPEFERQISPSESFEKEIVFDIPADVRNPRLDIREGFGIDHTIEAVLIGDEDSIFQKRQLFELAEQNAAAGVK